MTRYLENFARAESGATTIEYAIMASLVAMAVVGTLSALGATVFDVYSYVAAESIEATTVPAAGAP